MLVFALSLDVQVHLGSVAQALKEVEEHLCGHLANFFTMELSIPYQPGTASKVEGHLAEAVVHGQGVAITLYAPLVAKGPGYTLTYGSGCILNGVVLIDIEVTVGLYGQVYLAMLAYLFEHVVEEA